MSDEELAEYGWAVVADSGHGDCLGWHYDPETGRLACACGIVLAEAATKSRGFLSQKGAAA